MSNCKKSYGWYGHLITSNESVDETDLDHNVIVVPEHVFARLVEDWGYLKLDERIEAEAIGILCDGTYYLATGVGFSEGFTYFGTVFKEVEMREGGPMAVDHDAEYIAAMKEIYGIELPPSRPMIGCSSEH